MTAVEWLIEKIKSTSHDLHHLMKVRGEFEQAKQMEEEQKYETSAFWFGRGVLAGKENRIEELKPNK